MTAPASAAEVVKNLAALTGELQARVAMLRTAERDAAEKRHAADMAESRAFVNSDGSMDMRKHRARLEADGAESAAKIAEALVRVLRAEIRALETRIDVGRSYGATVRAELSTLGYSDQP